MAALFALITVMALVAFLLSARRSGDREDTGRRSAIRTMVLVVAAFVLGTMSYKFWSEELIHCDFDARILSCVMEQTRK